MEDIRYTAEDIEDALYSGLDKNREFVLASDYDALTAERDELQRRLDAVVMEHIRTAELKCYCEFDRDHERTMECEYCEEVTSLRAIAEGRTE